MVKVLDFDFDSNEPIPAQKPYKDRNDEYWFVISNLAATVVSLTGIRLILWVYDGTANAVIFWIARKLFWPLLHWF